jgi:hypothetical protein
MRLNRREIVRVIGVGLAGLLLAGSAVFVRPVEAEGVPGDWVAYYRPGNLVVPHPPGWRVQERGDGAFIVSLPGAGSAPQAVVYVKPQRFTENRNAADVLGLLPREEAALFPGAKVLRVSVGEQSLMGQLVFAIQGQAYRGTALVLIASRSVGSLFVIGATESAWVTQARPMTQILSSFRYLGAAPASGTLPEMVPWRDPLEGAFSLPVPRGWHVDGGLKRPNPIAYRPEILLASPDDTIQLRLGDAGIPSFGVPYAVPMVGMMAEGTTTAGYTVLMNYRPGAMFLTQLYLPNKFRGMSNVQIEDLPALGAQSFRLLPPAPPFQGRADAGAVRFDVQLVSGPRRAYYAAITRYQEVPGLSGSQAWYVDLLDILGYLCTPDREAQARAILGAMYRGFAWDLQWAQAQSRANAEIGRLVTKHVSEMNAITAEAIAGRAAGAERAMEPLRRAARGEIVLRDEQTGRTVTVPQTGSQNYYLVRRTGEIIASDRTDLPEFDFGRMTRVE